MESHADVAQLVEHHLAKVGVAGSNPVVRSRLDRVSTSEALSRSQFRGIPRDGSLPQRLGHASAAGRVRRMSESSRDPRPKARDDLRRVLIRDQADRDAISSRLLRYRDQNGQGPG
jgi:hypothetical protein